MLNSGGWTRFLKYQDSIDRINISTSNYSHLQSNGYKIGIDSSKWDYKEILLNDCNFNSKTSILINIPQKIKDEWVSYASNEGVIYASSLANSCNQTVQRKEGGTWYFGHNHTSTTDEFETIQFATQCVQSGIDSWSYAKWGAADSGNTSRTYYGTVNGINHYWNSNPGPYYNDLICAFVR